MRVLFLGEIVGKAGVYCIKKRLKEIKEDRQVDFVIANGDGATGGFGLGKNHSIYLRKLGIDVITSGECIYYKKDMSPHIQKAPYILRPANYPMGNPGRGWGTYTIEPLKKKIAVVSLLGQSGFNRVHPGNPFNQVPDIISRLHQQTNTILVDFHTTTTAEIKTMGELLGGKVSALMGTGRKTLTRDAVILNERTAFISGTGRTGSQLSVGGFDPEIEIEQFMTQVPVRSKESWEGLEIQGVIMEIDDRGYTQKIEVLKEPCQAEGGAHD